MTAEQIRRRRIISRAKPKATFAMSEGVIATPQTLNTAGARLLSEQALAGIGAPDSRPGIFLLTAAEVAALNANRGSLTTEEIEHLRPAVNTKDVLPYGAVLPPDHQSIVWLPSQHAAPGGKFPANMPTFEEHLTRFRPVLEAKVAQYKANRPWWSAHRPRYELVKNHANVGGWADLALTARWGESNRLVTALAPANALPLSGLHAITGTAGTSAAYLVGLLNSTVIQELATALAPGAVGQADIEALGLPLLDSADVVEIEATTRQIADVVQTMVTQHGGTWPDLPDTLRRDIALESDVTTAWRPVVGQRNWGTLSTVSWVQHETTGRLSGRLVDITVTEDLLGDRMHLHFKSGVMHLTADDHPTVDLRDLLARVVRGLKAPMPADVLALPLPVQPAALQTAYEQHSAAVGALVEDYRRLRLDIDTRIKARLDR